MTQALARLLLDCEFQAFTEAKQQELICELAKLLAISVESIKIEYILPATEPKEKT